ncbi:type II secretion system F family protein [Labedaea rhizosphaerae]|uniref:Tight adherence protein B n=1 Tax=Labedaea rhizosphaerae TaxID=598644 RepID=A0A4V3D075_LABRH|nr:type II secretion system F family protein [Labedaea rhizosphaerae]TDQ04745.1 tight adherence protein B [Labedaea rhizosphaerae]
MTAASAVLAALGILAWPDTRARARLRGLTRQPGAFTRPRWLWPPRLPLLLAAASAVGLLAFGPGGAAAAALITATLWRLHKIRRTQDATIAAVAGLAEALRSFADALRTGAHPVAAAEAAADDAHPDAATVLLTIAAASRLGGDIEQALATTDLPALAGHLPELGMAVRLSTRNGLPLADVLDATRRDLQLRARHAKTVQARMAGPRTTATILAALPLIGIALGESTGVSPIHVLAHTGIGQAMLVLGALLTSAGLVWTAKLTAQATHR